MLLPEVLPLVCGERAPMNVDELAAELETLREENRELFARLAAADARLDRLDRAHHLPPIGSDPPGPAPLADEIPLSERPTERLPKLKP